jgi:hypothetical protein
MQIICLIGQKRVGKDTVADLIQELTHNNIQRFALADPIKDIARIMFGFTENQLYGVDKDKLDESLGIKPRDFFEKFGTDIMQFDIYAYLPALEARIPQRTFWVHSLLTKIKKLENENRTDYIIITDVRGIHELLAIKKEYPLTRFIKITRPTISINTTSNTETHITQQEPELIKKEFIDAEIINDTGIIELKQKVFNILEDFNKDFNK